MVKLEVKDLNVKYKTRGKKVHAVNNVSFSLPEGESIGIAGESGCGKSTLGLTIIRAHNETVDITGKIFFDEKPILEMSDIEFTRNVRWKEIAMVFQGAMNSLDPVFTIQQQFHEILKKHGYQEDFQQLIGQVLNSMGLANSILDKFPHELSGGMKQRVVIAMALLLEPKFLIADEPTTALDVLVQAQIISLLKSLKKNGLSIMLISHDLGIISEIAEKVGIMYAGEIVEFGNLVEVYKKPKHPYTISLLNSIPKINEDSEITILDGNPPSLIDPPKGCKFYERCPHAMEKCKQEPPKISTSTGYVACWLYKD